MESLLSIIIVLFILAAIFTVVWYIVDKIPIPAPFNVWIKAAVGLIVILYLLGLLIGYAPQPLFLRR